MKAWIGGDAHRASIAGRWLTVASICLGSSVDAHAQVAPQRTRYQLPAANGHGAIVVDLGDTNPGFARRVTHFREHLYAVEEPLIDAQGDEVWNGSDFAAVYTRDLLYDAYFGLRDQNGQRWLTEVPADEDASGYQSWDGVAKGGTGIVTMVQQVGSLELRHAYFTPQDLPHAGFVMVMEVRNVGASTVPGVEAFSLHNLHLGTGRPQSPWNLYDDIGENGETLSYDAASGRFVEVGFAGTVVVQALSPVAHHGSAPQADPYGIVAGGAAADLPDNTPPAIAVDGAVGAFQFSLGDLAPGQAQTIGVAVVHHGDPLTTQTAIDAIESYVAGRDAETLLADEVALWAEFQTEEVMLPASVDSFEETVLRQSASMLRMGQVREQSAFLREWLDQEGIERRTRFETPGLPGTVAHNGFGAVLASLPPGNWTYAWIRDGAYAAVAMALYGMEDRAKDALLFYLDAEAGRFTGWNELEGYGLPDYQISLVRYYGFGVEETDFNAFGPNLEFDGFGLFLWALANYEDLTGDTSISAANWGLISTKIADVLVALIEPATGLIRKDSSIWESHWNGRERHWTYTNLTAVRGLCDAAVMAGRNGDDARSETYRAAAVGLREAMVANLLDEDFALASNKEELDAGQGYWDAAVLDAFAMGLFDPTGKIAHATLAAMDTNLGVQASGVGWSRNDDRTDHAGTEDVSPWGSDYDSAEWVITDLRGAMASRASGDPERADAITDWIVAQAYANYLMVAETFDENDGTYKFNTPMLGFGAGALGLTLAHRDGMFQAPACGAYYDETGLGGGDEAGTGADASTTAGDTEGASGESDGCGCHLASPRPGAYSWLVLVMGCMLGSRRRRDRRRPLRRLSNPPFLIFALALCVATSGCGVDRFGDDASDTGASDTGGGAATLCDVTFEYVSPGAAASVVITGEWHDFDLGTATPMTAEGDMWTTTIPLPPGLLAYKIVVQGDGDPQWILDPGQARRKYIGSVENSAVKVYDCRTPRLTLEDSDTSRPNAGDGQFTASVTYLDAAATPGPFVAGYTATLRGELESRALSEEEWNVEGSGDITVQVAGLADGKYTLELVAEATDETTSEPLLLVFWIEPEPFDWRGALVYMVMTDRFRDGDSSNNPLPISESDPRGDFQGGDLEGLRQAIADGSLDALGVRAIWLTPFQSNPKGAYYAADNIHKVTGYHGYWPTTAREVDERLGGAEALRAMVAEAHAHGIRVLQDYVINHVHEDHEYMSVHPEWFRTGCVCGTDGCDWTADALICQFTPYLPDVDHSVPAANAAMVADAIWWLDEFNLDGLRVDAVKHVEEAAVRNLSAEVRDTFEHAGTKYFLMGETAMGWSDCPDPCNDENYDTIAKYVGPYGLDGQFDFVLYHAAAYNTFAYGDRSLQHADYWTSHGLARWPEGAIMTPYIGSHDTARFASLADYRGQDGAHDRGVPFNQWDQIATEPSDVAPYERARVAMAWLLALPGAPLMYYGDEYGQYGGVDPNNRLMMKPEGSLNAWQSETLDFVRTMGSLRRQLPALRRGGYVSLGGTDDALVFARVIDPTSLAIVGLNRTGAEISVDVPVIALGLEVGAALSDALGGVGATVSTGGDLTVTIPAHSATVLTP